MLSSEELTRSQVAEPPGQTAPACHLLVIETGSSSRFVLPGRGSVVVGRGAGADVQVRDAVASRKHARFVVGKGGAVSVCDLDSHNGTRVNGERIAGLRALAPGDVVGVGDVLLVLYSDWPAARALLDPAAFRQRLGEEIERAVSYERPLGVAVVLLGGPRWEGSVIAQAAADSLRGIDVVGQIGDGQLGVVLPELPPEAVAASAQALVDTLVPRFPQAKAGFATCPADGCHANGLTAAALAAAALADPGDARDAAGCTRKLSFGGRSLWIADAAMIRLYQLIEQLASADLPVLICGETGTGKENVAHAIHHGSARVRAPIVTINCAAIPEALLESELFGYEKGAFTGAVGGKPGLLEIAHGGTVFLDEIGELTAPAQAKLLRALESKGITRVGGVQERAIDLRIVAATNHRLEDEVKAGRFRQDLFFRLGAATVYLPPLRERPREIAVLAQAFLDEARARAGAPPMSIAPSAMSVLSHHSWPGNVRELKNVMEFAAATARELVLETWHFPDYLAPAAAPTSSDETPAPIAHFRPLGEELRELERRRMQEALDAAGGVQKHAARLIAMPLRTFVDKVKLYGLSPRQRGGA